MITNSLQIFDYNGVKIRTVIQDGQIWFVAKDVCNVLGLKNSRKAVSELYDNDKGVTISYTPGGNQEMTTVNEPGLYKLIFKSRKAEAKNFQDWVFYKVLPDINKYGMYLSDKTQELYKNGSENFKQLLDKYVIEHEKVLSLQAKIDKMTSKAVLGNMVLALPGAICFGEAAKFYKQRGFDIGRNKLIRLCVDLGWLCKQKCQLYKPTQKGIEKGVVNIEVDANGCVRFTNRPMLTPKGFQELYNVLLITERPIEFLFLQGETE